MWWRDPRFSAWTDPSLVYPKGSVAPLRPDLKLAEYLQKARERSLSRSMIPKISSTAAPKEEANHGIAFNIAGIFGGKP